MSREMRAKQFQPFAALKGYEEALREAEKRPAVRREFAEEYQEEMDRKLRQLRKGDPVTAVYFREGEYCQISGTVQRIDGEAGILAVGQTKIPLADLCGIAAGDENFI